MSNYDNTCDTINTMSHLVLFMPLVMLLHGLLLQISVMFMPVLYILFWIGPAILNVIAF